jgi:hypothetical protein
MAGGYLIAKIVANVAILVEQTFAAGNMWKM